MATKNGSLEQAMALLIQNQSSFLAHLAETHKRQNETDARLTRIENDLEQIKSILVQHGEVLTGLPEAIREKIGFKPK